MRKFYKVRGGSITMYTFIPVSSGLYDSILMESYTKCSSIFSLYDLNDLITESTESSESRTSKVLDSIITFFKKIVSVLTEFMKKISSKLTTEGKKKSVADQFASVKKEIKTLKNSGVKTIDFYDVKEYDKCIKKFSTKINSLISNWEAKISDKTSTAHNAEIFIKKSDELIKDSTSRLNSIRSKKKPYPIDTVVEWIDLQIHSKGETQITMKEFIDQIERLIQYTNGVKKQLNEYSEKTGYIPMAKSIKDVMNNTTIFLKKNYDWVIAYSASTVLLLYSLLIGHINVSNGIEVTTGGEQDSIDTNTKKSASALHNAKQKVVGDVGSAYARISQDKKSKIYRVNTKLAQSAAVAGATVGGYLHGTKKRKDSIYDK